MIYKEFELSSDHPLIANLNIMLKWAKSSEYPQRLSGKRGGDLSEEILQRRIANEIGNNCWMSRFDHADFDFNNIQKYSAQVYEEQSGNTSYSLMPVAKTWYPEKGGYLGWHIDDVGDRIYSTWADGESFFRYRDPMTGEMVTSYDKPQQWNFRIFKFSNENPLWHCVYAKDTRISIGYRFVAN